MNNTTTKKDVEIDATGRKIGRLASEIAALLLGKNDPDFAPNRVKDITIRVVNVDDMDVPPYKESKVYTTFSGYPGGQKKQTLKQLRDKKGMEEILYRAVYGMLPKNKLRDERMKNVSFTTSKES